MRDQLKALLAASESHGAVIQILPLDAGVHPGLDGGLTLLSLAQRPDVAYISGHGIRTLIEEPNKVAACRYRYDLTVATALSPSHSADMIRSAMDDL